ncbi:GNAT family N-acetyltransferase [Sphingomonas sp.]|uniref:GNAT family N-acetyltransferase n=1 Tax=Sphingomonas sp. TaxID=28214 RepID=UPI002DD6461B|nr:N-acetyltransferase [Sphingomonas sp.]
MPIAPIADIPAADVESLLDRAFGADRRTRTAYRLRAGSQAIPELSFAMRDDAGALQATLQSWPVRFDADDGHDVPMVLIGPVAVEPAIQRGGIGRVLTHHMLDRAATGDVAGADALMLIGDPEYYGRFFGFTAVRTAGWRLPGPFDPRRLLTLGTRVPDGAGTVRPRP